MRVDYLAGAGSVADITSHANAAEAVVAAINEKVFRFKSVVEKQAQLSEMSFKLRSAFSFDPESLPPLPLQLGFDHEKASHYILKAVEAWLSSQALADLFVYLEIGDSDEEMLRELLSTCVSVETAATWLCTEFNGIRTSRHALHMRRFVAIKLTNEATAAIWASRRSDNMDRASRQVQLNIWTDLGCALQKSLHYRTVIAPICDWLLALASEEGTQVRDSDFANDPNPSTEMVSDSKGSEPNAEGSRTRPSLVGGTDRTQNLNVA